MLGTSFSLADVARAHKTILLHWFLVETWLWLGKVKTCSTGKWAYPKSVRLQNGDTVCEVHVCKTKRFFRPERENTWGQFNNTSTSVSYKCSNCFWRPKTKATLVKVLLNSPLIELKTTENGFPHKKTTTDSRFFASFRSMLILKQPVKPTLEEGEPIHTCSKQDSRVSCVF